MANPFFYQKHVVEYTNFYYIVIDTSNCEMGKKGEKPLGFAKGRKEIQQFNAHKININFNLLHTDAKYSVMRRQNF